MKNILTILAAVLLLSACERDIPVVDPTALDNRNIYIRCYKYFDGDLLDTGKVYAVNGDLIKINHLYMTFSGAEFVSYNGEDTTRTESDLTMMDILEDTEIKLAALPKGSYNGTLHYNIGLDSARAHTAPDNFESSNPLSKGHTWIGQDLGHSFVQLEGSVFDPADTVFTTPKSTFTWRIATQDMVLPRSENRNFNVSANGEVFFVVNLDVDKLFVGLSPSAMPEIYSDPASSADYTLAQILRDNLMSDFIFKL